jgi:hypothetical protein
MAKPESSIIVALIVLFLGLEPHAVAQKSGGLGAIPSALLPQIQQLASLLQRNVAEGKLSDAQIQSELEQGNLAALIHRLGPEAASLLEQIKTTLQSNYTEVQLDGMLQGLVGSTPPSIVTPSQ